MWDLRLTRPSRGFVILIISILINRFVTARHRKPAAHCPPLIPAPNTIVLRPGQAMQAFSFYHTHLRQDGFKNFPFCYRSL